MPAVHKNRYKLIGYIDVIDMKKNKRFLSTWTENLPDFYLVVRLNVNSPSATKTKTVRIQGLVSDGFTTLYTRQVFILKKRVSGFAPPVPSTKTEHVTPGYNSHIMWRKTLLELIQMTSCYFINTLVLQQQGR